MCGNLGKMPWSIRGQQSLWRMHSSMLSKNLQRRHLPGVCPWKRICSPLFEQEGVQDKGIQSSLPLRREKHFQRHVGESSGSPLHFHSEKQVHGIWTPQFLLLPEHRSNQGVLIKGRGHVWDPGKALWRSQHSASTFLQEVSLRPCRCFRNEKVPQSYL